MPAIRILLLLAALVVGVTASGVATTPAAAATPCWKRLVDDWVKDAVIDKAYPVSCYREALQRLPDDLEGYTAIREDIQRGLQEAIRANNGREPEVVQPAKEERDRDPLPGIIAGGNSGGGDDGGGGGDDGGLLDRLLPRANGTSSVPLPLLVLAGLALLLLAAAAVSFATRQLQARRLRTSPPIGKPPTR